MALGPHPQLDLWEKALEVQRQLLDVRLVRVGAPETFPVDGVVDFVVSRWPPEGRQR